LSNSAERRVKKSPWNNQANCKSKYQITYLYSNLHRATLCLVLLFSFSITDAHEAKPAIAQVAVQPDNQLEMTLLLNLETVLAAAHDQAQDTHSKEHKDSVAALRSLSTTDLKAQFTLKQKLLVEGITQRNGEQIELLNFKSIFINGHPDSKHDRYATLKLSATLPVTPTTLRWQWSKVYGPVVLRVDDPAGAELLTEHLQPGQLSKALSIRQQISASNESL